MFQKLKQKWEVESDFRLVLIFLSYSLAGSATLLVRKPIFHLLNIHQDTPFVLKALLYVSTVTPSYFVMLLIIGTLLGEFRFFWAFEKRVFARFKRNRKKT